MRPWILAVPFAVTCVAWAARLLIQATWTPADEPNRERVALQPSVWLPYLMLVQSVFLEWRHFGLRSRPARLWAYGLTLFSNAFLPIIVVLLVFGSLLVLTQGSVVAPFIYTLF